jgi:hypothetical protein
MKQLHKEELRNLCCTGDDNIKKHEMGRTCSAHRKNANAYKILGRKI